MCMLIPLFGFRRARFFCCCFPPLQKVDVMPSYRDQIPDDAFSVSLVIVPEDDEDAGSSFAFQEQDQIKVGPAATQQGAYGGER